jgi:nucleoside-diphosphate-sugar epimerase
MQITILGGGGFLGRKLAHRLAADGALGGRAITGLTLFDLHAPAPMEAPFPVRCLGGDVADAAQVKAAIPPGTGLVVHLAAVVSAAAEADFDLGLRVNLHGTLAVIEACRALAAPPRVLFTSSVASFGGGQDADLPDDARQIPTNSYGAQKAAAELFLQDATRRGFLDAVSIRLPTVIVRPGRPNKAASSFVSAILREPTLGLETPLPVPQDFKVWVCSPRRAVEWFLHAATMDTAPLGVDRGVNPPGLCITVREMLSALPPLDRARVQAAPDAEVAAIVGGWPASFTAERARALGFTPQEGVLEILAAFREDDLAATRAERGL